MALMTIDPGNMDLKKGAGNFFTLLMLGAIGFAAYVYLLPFLLTVVWGTVELIVGMAVLGVLIMAAPKLIRALKYLGIFLGQAILGWVIELNPFNILEYKLNLSQKDADKLQEWNKKLLGKQSEITDKINEADRKLKIALNKRDLAKAVLAKNPDDSNAQNTMIDVSSEISSLKEYIEGMKPTQNDLTKIINITERGYKSANLAIRSSKRDLSMKRDLYETVTTAYNAIGQAWKALFGDKDVNEDAEKAIEYLRKDIGNKTGKIKNGIKVTSQYMDSNDLENASKLQTALKQLEGINLDTINYSDTLTPDASKMEIADTGKSKYLDLMK